MPISSYIGGSATPIALGISAEILAQLPTQSNGKTEFRITLDDAVTALFAVFKQIQIPGKIITFGGYPRDILHLRLYSDVDVLLESALISRDQLLRLMRENNHLFIQIHPSHHKDNLVSAKFKYGNKTIDLDISIGSIEDFKPFLTSHALYVDEERFVYDRYGVLNGADLKSYQESKKILSLYSKEELEIQFSLDPIKMIKAIKESARLGKDLHEDIVAAIQSIAPQLYTLAPSLILSQLSSVCISGENVKNFMNIVQNLNLTQAIFHIYLDKKLSETALNWIADVAIKMGEIGSMSAFARLLAPLIIVSLYHESMQSEKFKANEKYIFYFSLHCAVKFLSHFMMGGADFKSRTMHYWLSELFFGLFFILKNGNDYNITDLIEEKSCQFYMDAKVKDLNDDFFFEFNNEFIGFSQFYDLKDKFCKNGFGRNARDIKVENKNHFLAFTRVLFVYFAYRPDVSVFRVQCIAAVDKFKDEKEVLVDKLGNFIAYFIDYKHEAINVMRNRWEAYYKDNIQPIYFYTPAEYRPMFFKKEPLKKITVSRGKLNNNMSGASALKNDELSQSKDRCAQELEQKSIAENDENNRVFENKI